MNDHKNKVVLIMGRHGDDKTPSPYPISIESLIKGKLLTEKLIQDEGKIDVIYTSPTPRAYLTAKMRATTANCALWLKKDLKELSFFNSFKAFNHIYDQAELLNQKVVHVITHSPHFWLRANFFIPYDCVVIYKADSWDNMKRRIMLDINIINFQPDTKLVEELKKNLYVRNLSQLEIVDKISMLKSSLD